MNDNKGTPSVSETKTISPSYWNWKLLCMLGGVVVIIISVVAMDNEHNNTAGASSSSLHRYSHPNIKFRAPWMSTILVDDDTGLVYISGLVSDNIVKGDGSGSRSTEAVTAKGSVMQETLVILKTVEKVLHDLDIPDMSYIMNCVVHLHDVERDFDELNEAFASFFQAGNGPTRTTVQAGGRIVRGCLLEISVTAKRPTFSGMPPLPPDGMLQ